MIDVVVKAIQSCEFGTGDMRDWRGRKFYRYGNFILQNTGANTGVIASENIPCTFDEALAAAIRGRALIDANDRRRG